MLSAGIVAMITSAWAARDAARLSAGEDAVPLHPCAEPPGSVSAGGAGTRISSLVFFVAPSAGDDRRARDRSARRNLCGAVPRDRLDLGHATLGTWWEWDGRLTSMLLLFFVYLGFMALVRADDDRGGTDALPRSTASPDRSSCRSSAIRWCGGTRCTRGRASGSPSYDRFVDPVAATVHARRFHLVLRGRRADADAHDPRARQGRGADAADGDVVR